MENNEWAAVTRHWTALISFVDVKEAVNYLRLLIENPAEGTNIDALLESKEIEEFQDHTTVKILLEYLRRRVNGFSLLCATLEDARQGFLAEELLRTKERIPHVDSSPSIDVPESRREILLSIAQKLQTKRSYINIHGEQGIGTSRFLEQAIKYLQEECYFNVKRIDLADTPLILQQKYFTRMRYELNSEKSAMKKFCVFCVDNFNSTLLEQKPRHREHQKNFISNSIDCCKKLGISVLTTASCQIEGMENIEISRIPLSEMGRDLQKLFPDISDKEMSDLVTIFPETCNPLDCFLITTLYILYNSRAGDVKRFLEKHSKETRDDLFAAVYQKLSHTQQSLLLSVYSLPCNSKVTLPSIYCLYHGSSRQPNEESIRILELAITELVKLNLLHKDGDRYSMKDSNFFHHFRKFFEKKHHKSLVRYYLRGLHYYLDYAIKVIQDIEALCEFNELQEKEWLETIPRITFVLDPCERGLEEAILKRQSDSEPLYNKRMFVTQKLRTITLHIPTSTLMLSANNLLSDFQKCHQKYAGLEDKMKLLCLMTELSLSSPVTCVNARGTLVDAFCEVKILVEKQLNPAKKQQLKDKYYVRLLQPLAEIYVQEGRLMEAKKCYQECLKCSGDNKKINWLIRKRCKEISEDLKSVQFLEPPKTLTVSDDITPVPSLPSPVDQITSSNSLDRDIRNHIEAGDIFYVRGDLEGAFTYYFELYRKFHSQHQHLKDQEYILMAMGHLKLQRHPKLIKSEVLDAIKFYKESQSFYSRRKEHESQFLKIFLFTANLIAGHKRIAREMMIGFRDGQKETQTAFFMAIVHKDRKHRCLWKELLTSEKRHTENKINPQVVNYSRVGSVNYENKRQLLETSDKTKFVQFPSKDCLEYIELFDPSPLYSPGTEQRLTVYIKERSTRI